MKSFRTLGMEPGQFDFYHSISCLMIHLYQVSRSLASKAEILWIFRIMLNMPISSTLMKRSEPVSDYGDPILTFSQGLYW